MILKNHVKVLPKPWTPNGLKSCLKSLNNAEDINESHSNLLPGLIEGASSGTGLGLRFLAHVERCKVLLHLCDISDEDNLKNNYLIIREEVNKYSDKLKFKKEIILLSKCDLVDKKKILK